MCHSSDVTLKVNLRPGQSIFDQIVFAAQRALISGELVEGQPFPSVRALAAELKIHPNTAHKVVQHLIQERWLVAHPGVGTLVAQPPKARTGDRKRLLEDEVEKLVVEAMRVGAGLDEVQQAVNETWRELRPVKAIANE